MTRVARRGGAPRSRWSTWPITRPIDPTTRFAESERIDRAFRRLPLEQRTVLVLQHQFGMSHVEIAETLGVPVGTVKSRIRYGTAAMRAALEADDRVAAQAAGRTA